MKILIIAPAWVGDTVMSQPLFKLLKQQMPNCLIDVIAPEHILPLLTRMPEVNHAIACNIKHGELGLLKRYRLAKLLRNKNYQQAIVLPNSLKSALIPFFANIPKRTGWRGEWRYLLLNDLRVLDKAKYPLMVERFLALGLPADQPITLPYPLPSLQKKLPLNIKINSNDKILVLCPGAAFGSAKRWITEYFAEVANKKLAEHWQVWLLGAKDDLPIITDIMQQTEQRCINFAGKTSLDKAIDLLSCASVVVANDSGLMHIAAALDCPLVAIYGPTNPNFTPPLGSSKVKILTSHLPCVPCFKRECPRYAEAQCMRDITPSIVLQAIDELLS
jgi:heptosyltransferase-2